MEAEKEGFPVTAVREIKLLQLLDHENIIKISDIQPAPDGVSLVFDYYEHDLSGILQHPGVALSPAQVKYVLLRMLRALAYLHGMHIVHRDIKTSNVLIGRAGEIKLADFGLAKSTLHPDLPAAAGRLMTNRVVTLWYRPLELLLGAVNYGPEVDMWGLGCVLAELFTQKPLFPSSTETGQIDTIIRRFGPFAAPASWPWASLIDLDRVERDPVGIEALLRDRLPADAADLALALLQLDPAKRLTAQQALAHPFLTAGDAPAWELPALDGDWHEYECKQRRKDSGSKPLRP